MDAPVGTDLVLSTSGVAELLEVHPSTVKRWCGEGEFHPERTPGGHRRFRLPDVLRVASERGVPTFLDDFAPYQAHVWAAVEDVRRAGSFERLLALALGWLVRGRHDRVGRLVEALGDLPGVPLPLLLDRGVAALMERVGRAWREGRLGIGEEHLVTQTLVEALLRLRPGADGGPPASQGAAGLAVVGSAEGDQHHLGALCARLVLESAGWKTLYLGPSVPAEDFASLQRSRDAGLVCISFSPGAAPADARRTLTSLAGLYDPAHPYALAMGGAVRPAEVDGAGRPFTSLGFFDGCAPFSDALARGFGAARATRARVAELAGVGS